MRGFGRIFERGGILWIAYYWRGEEYRESTHLPVFSADGSRSEKSRRKAEQCLKKKLLDLGKGKQPGTAEDRVTVEELLGNLEVWFRIKRRASLRTVQSHLPALREAFGSDRAVDVTTARLNLVVEAWQRAKVADATINRRLATLRRAFTLARAVTPPRITTVPTFPKLDEHNARQGFFDKPTFFAVLAALPDDGLRDFVEWAFWTGMRKGEIAALTWDAFDRETWTLRLHARHAKSRRARRLVLTRELRTIVERRLAARRLDANLMFHRDGVPVREFRKSWATACKAAGVAGRLFHDLRRTGVRNLIRSGVERSTAMRISGHRTESVFERYNIGDDDDLRQAMERVSAYVDRLPSKPTVLPLAQAAGPAAGAVRDLSENGSQTTPNEPEGQAANS